MTRRKQLKAALIRELKVRKEGYVSLGGMEKLKPASRELAATLRRLGWPEVYNNVSVVTADFRWRDSSGKERQVGVEYFMDEDTLKPYRARAVGYRKPTRELQNPARIRSPEHIAALYRLNIGD